MATRQFVTRFLFALVILGSVVALVSCAAPDPMSQPVDFRQKPYEECVEDTFTTLANLTKEFSNTPGLQHIHVEFNFDNSKIPLTWDTMYVEVVYTFEEGISVDTDHLKTRTTEIVNETFKNRPSEVVVKLRRQKITTIK